MKFAYPTLAEVALATGLLAPSIVVRPLGPSGGSAFPGELEPLRELPAASMIKVPIAAALTALWAVGERRPGDRLTIAAENMTPNDAESPFVPGYRASLEELGRSMLARSDNVATNTLIDVIGRERATEFVSGCGLRGTAIRRKLSGALPLIDDPAATGRNAHPAGDAARLFELIARDEIPGAAWLRDALAAQEWNEKLNGGLQPGDRFAHKTGDTDEVSHDGGILELASGRRYVVVVYTALPSSRENDARFGDFMRRLRPLLD